MVVNGEYSLQQRLVDEHSTLSPLVVNACLADKHKNRFTDEWKTQGNETQPAVAGYLRRILELLLMESFVADTIGFST